MSTAEWFYLRDGQQVGPVGSGQLKQLASRGSLQPHDLVWRDGLTSWVPASRVKGLFPEQEYMLLEEEAPAGAFPPRSATGTGEADDSLEPAAKRPRKAARHGYAGFWKRLVALVVDTFALAAVIFCVTIVMAFSLGPQRATAIVEEQWVLWNLFWGVVNWLYFALQESSEAQATLGKRAMRIRVTDEDGRRISFGRATGRYFAKFLSSIVLGLGFLMAAFTERKQALHDNLAHTLVVND